MCSVEEFQTESHEISEKSEIQTSGRTMFIQIESGKIRQKMRKKRSKTCVKKRVEKHVKKSCKKACNEFSSKTINYSIKFKFFSSHEEKKGKNAVESRIKRNCHCYPIENDFAYGFKFLCSAE